MDAERCPVVLEPTPHSYEVACSRCGQPGQVVVSVVERAAPAVTETGDLRAAAQALVDGGVFDYTFTPEQAVLIDRLRAALAAPAVTETGDLRAALPERGCYPAGARLSSNSTSGTGSRSRLGRSSKRTALPRYGKVRADD